VAVVMPFVVGTAPGMHYK